MGQNKHSSISIDLRNRFLANLPILFLYSLAINVLIMAGPLFMLQVYDRVIPSQSIPTLSGLFTLVLVLFMFLSLFEFIRSRIITRLAYYVDRRANGSGMSGAVLRDIGDRSGKKNPAEPASRIRDFLRSGGIESFLDLLFVPVYLICLSALHPILSLVCLLGSFTLGAVTVLNNYLAKPLKAQTGQLRAAEKSLEGQYASHAREIYSMGMAPVLMEDLRNAHGRFLSLTHTLLSKSQFFKSLSKGIRPLVQASTLAAGAYLVINGELTAGTMIASSIMAGRLLQPIDQSINHWPEFVLAKRSYERLKEMMEEPSEDVNVSLARPEGKVEVVKATVLDKDKMSKGLAVPILRDINFALNKGDGLCIAGPSGSGKSVLIDMLIGHIVPDRGELRLDGSRLQQWDRDKLGQFVGFLPQNARPMPGTIAQNISRFMRDENLDAVIKAAQLCGIHERILGLPDGYNTEIDDRNLNQPAALVQMICLARAVYGGPSILILDEPAANLDHECEHALVRCIHQLRVQGVTVMVATHKRFIMQYLNKVLILNKGVQVSLEDNKEVAVTLGTQAIEGVAA